MRQPRLLVGVFVVTALATLIAACSATHAGTKVPELSALKSESLRKFRNWAEFEAYRDRVRALGKSRGVYWSQLKHGLPDRILLAQNAEEPCDPTVMDCDEQPYGAISVTGSKVASRQASITNNQENEVDEGDIVKQYGRYLVALQDGRLFSIDTGARRAELRLVDRVNLYSSPEADTWYDELLIHENTLVVTGYNYGEDASEINVLSIDESGGLQLQARYFLQSEDYYSGENYASRLVRGQLVLYTPVDISGRGPLGIPRMRRWTADAGFSTWLPLFDITDVYRPIQETLTPTLHVVSVCNIGVTEAFACKSRGIIGPYYREVYVSASNVYLWLTSDYQDWGFGRRWPDECAEDVDLYSHEPLAAAVFQLPFQVDAVRAIHLIGTPNDQFAFDERDGRLLALLERQPADCYTDDVTPMIFASIPLELFGPSPVNLDSSRVSRLPATKGYDLQNRYTRDYLVYAGSRGYWSPRENPEPAELVLVPVANPAQVTVLHPRHTIERLEVIGDNAVSFGRAGKSDLGVSTVELRTAGPHVASTRELGGMRESEGRSHAFNAIVTADGSGAFGLPTVYRSKFEKSWNTPSDVQFFTMDKTLAVTPVGELAGVEYVAADGYECDVSCYDWYGDARPIFTGGRVFALTGSELVEGEIKDDMIVEIARLRMTAMPAQHRNASQ